ncbi:MAG: low molecular weight phosphotyrosine protein phosphatase [Ruminococcaceae bacterium]|nr:low molecular weight phosphotyrosine protein phosphatase [Oscillospiraceae bacterium]
MKRILFICHGNICRSPMAEFIFKKLILERGCASRFAVASAATSDEEIWNGVGSPMYPPAKAMLRQQGIPYEERRAVRLTKGDYERYDLLIGMDHANFRQMHRLFGSDPSGKLHLLLDFTARGGEVADPWYSGRFDVAFRDIYEGCQALLDTLLKEKRVDNFSLHS